MTRMMPVKTKMDNINEHELIQVTTTKATVMIVRFIHTSDNCDGKMIIIMKTTARRETVMMMIVKEH